MNENAKLKELKREIRDYKAVIILVFGIAFFLMALYQIRELNDPKRERPSTSVNPKILESAISDYYDGDVYELIRNSIDLNVSYFNYVAAEYYEDDYYNLSEEADALSRELWKKYSSEEQQEKFEFYLMPHEDSERHSLVQDVYSE